MTSPSVKELLVVKKVCHRKQDGTLYLMAECIAWGPEGKGHTVSHLYADIRCQKISPDGKARVQLQLVLHTGENTTFHFYDESGALKDRDATKELLQQLLPKFKKTVNKELEEKNRMLKDPALFQLYKDLVVSEVISAEDFWSNRLSKNNAERSLSDNKQDVGISGAFLADIRPQSDGCNGLRYNLTADIIESVFRTYPAVRQKYGENVPHNMTEKVFWTNFFQSQYFHRDRTNNTGTQDIFSECVKHDERGLTSMAVRRVKNPLVDLLSFEDKTWDEGYGTAVRRSASASTKTAKASGSSAIVKRFNHLSAMVMAAGSQKPDGPSRRSNETSGADAGHSAESDLASRPSDKKAKLQEATAYVDQQTESRTKTVPLNLKKSDGYSYGPMPLPTSQRCTASGQDVASSLGARAQREMSRYNPGLARALSGSAAASAIAALSPGGVLAPAAGGAAWQDAANPKVSGELQEELRHLYAAATELLRHFWSCFPVNTPFLEQKVAKMRSNLERFRDTKLCPFRAKVQRQRVGADLTGHLEEMVQAARAKFQNWQSHRMLTN